MTYAFVLFTGRIQPGYCKECKVNLEPNCPLEEHQRSRKHINRLLQLGIEVPISCINHTEENHLPEGDILFPLYLAVLFDYTVWDFIF